MPPTLPALVSLPAKNSTDWYDNYSSIQNALAQVLTYINSAGAFAVALYGAVGDGVTNDTAAIQQAADDAAAAGGGTVIFASGRTYGVVGTVLLGSNTTVDLNGATIQKLYTGSQTSTTFVNRVASGATGYGSGAKNITIRNGKIKGNFSAAGVVDCSTGWHHVDNLKFVDVTFEECQQNSHVIDLGGCRNVKVINCTFAGHKIVAGREFVEAIQIDSSSYAGSPYKPWPTNSYDGLPTRGVLVDGCTFTTLKVGSTTYDMPNAIGSHGAVLTTDDGFYESIRFVNNLLEGYNLGPAANATLAYGWLHFRGVRGALVSKNIFRYVGPSGQAGYPTVVNFMPVTGAIPLADVALSSPSSATVDPPRQSTDVEISSNLFIGFASAPLMAGASLIYLRSAINAHISHNVVDGASCSAIVAALATTGDGPRIRIDNNTLDSSGTNTDPVISMSGHVLSSIQNNNIRIPSGGTGIRVDDGNANEIMDNVLNGGGYGVYVTGGTNSIVSGCSFTSQATAGLVIGPDGAGSTAFDWIVSSNRSRSMNGTGFINGSTSSRMASWGNFWSSPTPKADTGISSVVNAHLDR